MAKIEIEGFVVDQKHHQKLKSSANTSFLENFINFLRVSPQKHLPSLTLGLATLLEFELLGLSLPTLILGSGFFPIIVYQEMMAVENFQRYKKIKSVLSEHGWDERMIHPMTYTWCGRYAARIAAIDTGFKKEIEKYYRDQKCSWLRIKR